MTWLGYFWNVLATNFLTKAAQIFGNSLGYFEKHYFLSKNCRGYFLATFGIKLDCFLFQHLATLVETFFGKSDIQMVENGRLGIGQAKVDHLDTFVCHMWERERVGSGPEESLLRTWIYVKQVSYLRLSICLRQSRQENVCLLFVCYLYLPIAS